MVETVEAMKPSTFVQILRSVVTISKYNGLSTQKLPRSICEAYKNDLVENLDVLNTLRTPELIKIVGYINSENSQFDISLDQANQYHKTIEKILIQEDRRDFLRSLSAD